MRFFITATLAASALAAPVAQLPGLKDIESTVASIKAGLPVALPVMPSKRQVNTTLPVTPTIPIVPELLAEVKALLAGILPSDVPSLPKRQLPSVSSELPIPTTLPALPKVAAPSGLPAVAELVAEVEKLVSGIVLPSGLPVLPDLPKRQLPSVTLSVPTTIPTTLPAAPSGLALPDLAAVLSSLPALPSLPPLPIELPFKN